MKKLYKKSTVHPSPPLISDHLSFLPAAIFTLTVALSQDDKEVLAYLISSSTNFPGTTTNTKKTFTADHPPGFNCSCFRCYMSYWVRWDSSPNRQLIHEIIDAFEDSLVPIKKDKGSKKDRKRKVNSTHHHGSSCSTSSSMKTSTTNDSAELTRSPEKPELLGESESESVVDGRTAAGGGGVEEEGSVRKLVSFLGERIWSVWT